MLLEKLQNLISLSDMQSDQIDPVVTVRVYDPVSIWGWYLVEIDGIDSCFGLVLGGDRDLGYFRLSELEKLNTLSGSARITIDYSFSPCKLSEIYETKQFLE